MTKQIENQISYSQTRMAQEVMQMQFRFQNLCVKAEPTSLLQVEVQSHGSILKIEQCADVVLPEWNKFQMFLKNPDDLSAVSTAVLKAHPEFKKDVVPATASSGQASAENTLVFIMPEVDKNRRDLLKAAVETIYTKTKLRLAELQQSALSSVTIALMDTPDDVKEAKEALDKSSKVISSNMDDVRKAKDKEIDDAYAKYLEAHPDQAVSDEAGVNGGSTLDDVSKSVQLPDMPEAPKMPDMPEAPKMPDMPDASKIPSWKS